MRADSRQTSERIAPARTRPEDSPKKPRKRSAPEAQIAEAPPEVPSSPSATEPISLLPQEAASQFRSRWETIQSGFVDDPRHTVEQAGALSGRPVRGRRVQPTVLTEFGEAKESSY